MKKKTSYDLTGEQVEAIEDFLQGKLSHKEFSEKLGTSAQHTYIVFAHTVKNWVQEGKLTLK